MKSEYENHLEAAIHRELNSLPELDAPESIATRVMAVIERRAVVPWYRRSWQAWPRPLQLASFVAMLVMFYTLCFAAWKLSQAEAITLAMRRVGDWFTGFQTIGNTLAVLASSTVLVIRNLGMGFLLGCLFMACLAYALCIGLGTVCVRLAYNNR